MTQISGLIFAYNADGGPMALALDFAHKILSPKTYPCSLCNLTHGAFSMREEWRDWLGRLPYPVQFYHRDEFIAAFPSHKVELPTLFAATKNGKSIQLLSATEISAQKDVKSLIAAIESKLDSL